MDSAAVIAYFPVPIVREQSGLSIKINKINKFRQYFPGRPRTLGNIKMNKRRFIVLGKGKNAPKYKNCVRNIVNLWGEGMDGVRTLSLFPIDPLHVLLLGPINDLIPILRKKFPTQMDDFMARHNLKNNEGIGGTFAGLLSLVSFLLFEFYFITSPHTLKNTGSGSLTCSRCGGCHGP